MAGVAIDRRYAINNKSLLICSATIEAALLLIHLAREPAEQVALLLVQLRDQRDSVRMVVMAIAKKRRKRFRTKRVNNHDRCGIVFRLTLLASLPAASQDVQR